MMSDEDCERFIKGVLDDLRKRNPEGASLLGDIVPKPGYSWCDVVEELGNTPPNSEHRNKSNKRNKSE